MVKRIKTPPPPEDEPRYLTVVHPYPLNANLELHADRRTLALWLACCTGKDVLFAMFHKPASPGMVVIEVDRDFDNFDKLLGLHTWAEFLKRPSDEQGDKTSKVFYCTYNTGRLVEKNGWKRVNIEEHWFQGWTQNNSIIKHPYPKTKHCDVPSEAKTGAPMCRPLPQKSFPVPPPTPAPPVGSADWLAARSANPTASPAPSTTRKGRKAAPSDTASVTSVSSRGAQSFSPPRSVASPPPSITSPTPSVMANYRAKNNSAWKRGPPSVSSVASSISSRAPSTAGSSNAWSSRGAPPPPAPPGLDSRLTSQSRTSDRFDWSEDVERFEAEQMNNPPIRSQAPSVSSAPARRPPYDPDGPVEPSRNYEYTEEDKPRHSTVAAMSDIFDDDVPPPATPSVRSGRGGTQPPGLNDPDYDPWNPPAEAADFADDQPEACDSEAPWVNYAEPRLEPPTKIKKKGQWTCSQHGSLCSPGICKERAKHECDERMQKEREKWDEEKRQRDAARAKKHKKREKKEADAEAMGQGGRARPPHFGRGNTSSGNNSSSNNNNRSGADSDTSRDRDPPDQEDWSTQIPWESRDVDAQSVVSSARPAWDNGDDVSDDDDYDHDNNDDDGASVAESRTSSVASHSSRPPAPANVWGNNNSKPGPPQISPTSPRPASRQSAWDARSSASVPENVWPSVSGFSRAGSVTGSDSGPRSGTRPPTTADSRSSVSSGVRAPITFSAVPSGPKGFPTHADTEWGDPIAKAMAAAAKDKSEEGSGSEEGDGDGAEEKSTKSTKKKKKKQTKKARAPVLAKVSTVDAVLEEIPAGGPGSSWGNPDEPW